MAGVLALNIYSTSKVAGETIKSVKVTPSESNTKFCGAKTGTDLTVDGVIYAEGTSTSGKSVTVNLSEPYDYASAKPEDKKMFDGQIYVVLAKQSYSSVTFEITTNKNVYTITSSGSALDLEANDFYPVNINLAKASKEVIPTVFTVGTEIANVFPTTKNGIKFTYGQGESTNAPTFYTPFRWYKSSTVTISAGTTPLESIEFVFTSTSNNDYSGSIKASSGTITINEAKTLGTWMPAGNETSVTFTNDGNAARFSKISVVTEVAGTESVVSSTPTLSLTNMEIAAESSANLTIDSNHKIGSGFAGMTFTSSNPSVATVDKDGTVSGVSAGTAVITATIPAETTDYYVINEKSATCEVTVTSAIHFDDVQASDWSYVFTNNPWGSTSGSVDLRDGNTTINWALDAKYAQYNSGLLALNTSSNKNEATLSTNNKITNVSSVVVYAKTNSGKKVSLTVKVGATSLGTETLSSVADITAYSFTSATPLSGNVSIEFTEPDGGYQIKQIRINPVSYTINCATVNNGSVVASANTAFSGETVTLTATPNDGYELEAWSVVDADNKTVAVSKNSFTMPASNVTVSASFRKLSGNTATFTFGENITATSGTINGVNLSTAKNNGSSDPAYNTNEKQLRIYRYNSLTLSCERNITSIVINYDGTYIGSDTAANTGSYSCLNSIGTWTGSSNSVTITNTGTTNVQMRITSIVVTFE